MKLWRPLVIAVLLYFTGFSRVAYADLDIGFVLDTTGSMARELREVKEKVSLIAKALQESRPDETIRIGIVAYRDVTDKYVTKETPLSSNIQDSLSFLRTLRAKGGGDRPEHVMAGLQKDLDSFAWVTKSDAERQIFLIGDAAPHLDYPQQPTIESVAERARELGVVINAIGCRSLFSTGIDIFRRIAYANEGRYQHIGGMKADGASVSRSVLDTLSKRPSSDAFSGTEIKVHLLGSEPVKRMSPFFAALYQARSVQGDFCSVRMESPEGWKLRGVPTLKKEGDTLFINARLEPGYAEEYLLALQECLGETVRIHVQIGEGNE